MKSNLNPEYLLSVRNIIGAHFKKCRIEKGISQKQLADKMQISQSTVAKIENGSWNFTLDFLVLFCHHLDLYLFLPEKEKEDDLVQLMKNRHFSKNQEN